MHRLSQPGGIALHVLPYGGIITELLVPDRDGNPVDVVLGFDGEEGYRASGNPAYFGALIGRFGNRIANGTFTLDGTTHNLPINNAPNSLHGGNRGFDKVTWEASPFEDDGAPSLRLAYISKDGEEGYPGTLETTVLYQLPFPDTLRVNYRAVTDRPTVINLTQHSFFNLAGHAHGSNLDHEMTIRADLFTPVNEKLIPTGELQDVTGTPFDFRTPHRIGARIGGDEEQLRIAGGYDHNWVINGQPGILRPAASAAHAATGIRMDVFTTEPGMQFYSGNFLDGTLSGKEGFAYPHRSGFCLETQHFPNAPNQPTFPTTVLEPGDVYETETQFRFSRG